MAIVTALFAAMLSIGLGLSVAFLGSAEITLAGHDRDARALAYASRGAAALAVSELRALPSLVNIGQIGASPDMSARPGSFVDATLTPAAPWGAGTLDLHALTAVVQAEADAGSPPGAVHPAWRLFVFGSLDRLAPGAAAGMPCYVAAWVADAGGLVLVRAAAYGPGDARAVTEVSLIPPAADKRGAGLRVVAVRPDP